MNLPQLNSRFILVVGSFLIGFLLLDSVYFNIVIGGKRNLKWNFRSDKRSTPTRFAGSDNLRLDSGKSPTVYTFDPSIAQTLAPSNDQTLAPSIDHALDPSIGHTLKAENDSEYLLNTELCKIPRTAIMPEYFKKRWKVEKIPDCDYEEVIAEVTDDGVLELLPAYRHTNCCFHEILRVPGKDNSYKLTDCEPVETDVNTEDKEEYVLRCNKSLKFEVNLPVPPKVEEKVAYWKAQDPDSRPISMIFVGFDTVSRSHAFRSIPRTLGLLEEMGFHDFVGYHSVAPSTLTNFMAFLMGLKRTDVRKTCTPSWSSHFDSCPLIWKNYSQHNYVTMYLEDGEQTFNWGGQSGFKEKPTDYYHHPFFNAVEDMHLKDFPYFQYETNLRTKQMRAYCTSNETAPQFSIRYTRRFIRKFKETPFFAFTWFAYPYHEYAFALAGFDNNLLSFFEYLKSSPSILRNSLIVFNADHGERDGFFKSKGVEGYIERGLPPLFIRLPERLLEMYPEMDLNQVLRGNTQHLVSPFDLHHTFLHLLSISGLNVTAPDGTDFQPVLPDRASLFVPIELTSVRRDCQNLNIFSDSCVCNTLVDIEPIESPYVLGKVTGVLQAKLRSMVKDSGYEKDCAEWSVKTGSVISAQVLSKEEKSTINLIRFEANPGGANFEAKVRIVQKESNFDSCEIIGNLNRINLYGDQSGCVGAETDMDKTMKAFCICKSKVEKNKYGF